MIDYGRNNNNKSKNNNNGNNNSSDNTINIICYDFNNGRNKKQNLIAVMLPIC